MWVKKGEKFDWDAVLLWIQFCKAVREGKLSPWSWHKVARENGFEPL